MKQYFYIKDGNQVGPFPINQLASMGLKADDYVWCEGMPEWKKASDVADFNAVLSPQQGASGPPPAAGGPPPQAGYQQPGAYPQQPPQSGGYQPSYQQPGAAYNPYGNTPYEMKQPIPNSVAVLVLGICSIVFGFCYGIGLILGIIGLALHAPAKRTFESQPDLYDRNSFNNLNAGKICSIIGIVIAVLVIIWLIVVLSMMPYRYGRYF